MRAYIISYMHSSVIYGASLLGFHNLGVSMSCVHRLLNCIGSISDHFVATALDLLAVYTVLSGSKRNPLHPCHSDRGRTRESIMSRLNRRLARPLTCVSLKFQDIANTIRVYSSSSETPTRTHTHSHTHNTRTHMHTYTHAHTHARAHAQPDLLTEATLFFIFNYSI